MSLHRLSAAAGAALATAAFGAGPMPAQTASSEPPFSKCHSCHSLQAGENLASGPSLHGIVGKKLAGEPGVAYSPALRRFAERHPLWTPELLDRFIADPEALVPGTYMSFHGIADAEERAALIAYLQRVDAREPPPPPPLPNVSAE